MNDDDDNVEKERRRKLGHHSFNETCKNILMDITSKKRQEIIFFFGLVRLWSIRYSGMVVQAKLAKMGATVYYLSEKERLPMAKEY